MITKYLFLLINSKIYNKLKLLLTLSLQKVVENKFIRLFSFKSNSKSYLIACFLISFFIFDLSKAESNNSTTLNNAEIGINYLDSRNELEDYIIDSGDEISIDFYPAEELSGIFPVNEEGELILPRLDETFVRGLTISELKTLLEKRYAEFLINPEIKVRIAVFKSIRVLVSGELRNPGLYKFPAYQSGSFTSFTQSNKGNDEEPNEYSAIVNEQFEIDQSSTLINGSSDNMMIKRTSTNITTISDVIREAGGISSLTDLSRITIIRDIPLGKGGGKKKAVIDFSSFNSSFDSDNDLRIFDGDRLFFPKLSKADPTQIPKSILNGLSPKFITVDIFGRVENPGNIKLPLEAALSDAINLTGPIKPLSGKIVLIRYNPDGTILNQKISYSARAKRGSKRNPFVKQGDLISVKNSFLGKSTGVIREVTAPFVGIYSTKEIIEGFD